jgi:hypothetical protein
MGHTTGEPWNLRTPSIVAVLSLVTVEYGGWALLSFISGREGLADWQKLLFRAGHAHAGILLVLVYLLYLPRGCVVGLLRHHPAPRNAQPPRPVCGSPSKPRVGTRGCGPGGWLDSPMVGASMLAAWTMTCLPLGSSRGCVG